MRSRGLRLGLALTWAASICTLGTMWPASGQEATTTTVSAPTTSVTTVPATSTSTFPPERTSGQPCADSLACQQVTAQDLSRMRGEVLSGLALLVLMAGTAVGLLVMSR